MQNFRQGEKFLRQKGRVLPLPLLLFFLYHSDHSAVFAVPADPADREGNNNGDDGENVNVLGAHKNASLTAGKGCPDGLTVS